LTDHSGRLTGLSPKKRELLNALLREKRAAAATATFVPPRGEGVDGDLPLSFAQERLWLVDQLDPGNAAYIIPSALRFTGALSVWALRETLTALLTRHEPLRTRFEMSDSQPVQVIDPAGTFPLPLVDLAGLPTELREAEAGRLVQAEVLRPFDIRRGPVFRATLLRLFHQEHALLSAMHHIVSDGWSMGIFANELGILYSALSTGRPGLLPPLPIQYVDFALWQRRTLVGPALEKQLAFWRQRLADLDPVLELPADRPRPSRPTGRGALHPLSLSPSLSSKLAELSGRERTTLFTTMFAAFFTLLYRQTGREDLLAGTPVAGRRHLETEGLIGFFVNTLVVRADLAGDPPFRLHLARVHEAVLDAQAHQDVPFERLVQELVTDRNPSYSPIFQVLFTLQSGSGRPLELPGLAISRMDLSLRTAKFDLSLAMLDAGDHLAGGLEYSLDLFDGATIERTARHLRSLLEAVVSSPDTRLSDLPLLGPAERHQLLTEWNAPVSAYPRESCLPELFERVARERSEMPALVSGEEVWTYGRLDEASNRLARRLRALGVGIETAVGISMERSPELILGILAILKAGGVYVPLDAEYPDERLDFMLADTGAELVLVHGRTRERLRGRGRLVEVDAGAGEPEGAGSFLGVRVPAESLAYVIYTSGSTGRPKGVAVPHRAIVRLVRETNYVRLGPEDRTGHVANISFDAATYEIWGALLNGGAVVVIPREVALSPLDFAAALREQRVTSMFLTSALFARMSVAAPEAFQEMSELSVGGEAVDPVAARTVLAGRPPRRLLNVYGPTESTTFASWHLIREVPAGATAIPIGLPLANTSLHVLDRWQGLVPPGTAGELYIGGDGLARGYVNRPELTAERFVPHPWESGGRLYRTGDLVRRRPDGAIEFLGRLDHQVKIRGFRIEPGEIEAILAGHPDLREAVVLAPDDPTGGRRLVAWVVPYSGASLGNAAPALRVWLQERLPEYMVPTAFVVLDALPLTPNGKVDRKALPAPEQVRAVDETSYAAPADPVEELLAGLWGEVLRLDRVSVHDDFFALGGHSLLATQVVSRVREVFGVELPLRAFFEAPTVARLAQVVREGQAAAGPRPPALVPVPREGDLPLSFAQQRLWFLDQLEPGSTAYNIPSAIRLSGELEPELLERIFSEIVRRHEALRTTFASHGGRPVQVISPPESARPELSWVSLLDLPEAEREERAKALAQEEAWRPFDLRMGPLLRLTLVCLSESEHVLLMTMHHIVSDGWSMGVLVREIATLHGAFSRGEASPLPELPVQAADFAVWQRQWLDGAVLEAQLAFWKSRLAGAPAVLELPTDRPRLAVRTYYGAYRGRSLAPAVSAAVRELCRREGVTPFMALLAGWAVLLGRQAGQRDVLVGSPIAGRNRREIEGLIGLFVNTLVLRIDLAAGPAFRQLLGQVRATALDAFQHQDLPFERVVEELVPGRDLSHSPLFQVLFVLQNTPRTGFAVPGLTLTPVEVESRVARVDLTLSLQEDASGFNGGLEYNTDLFDGATAERFLARFEVLLEAAAGAPALPFEELPLLLPAERQQALHEWNDTAVAYPRGVRLQELVAAQAERTPEAVAASFDGEELTYAELVSRARGLARHLTALGVEADGRVGVLLERSLEMIVGLLGILEAGAAYVPLDPTLPPERLGVLVDSARASVVIAQERLAHLLPSCGEKVVLVDRPLPPAEAPEKASATGEAGLAYVLFTSGSTGTPKGVMIPHQGIVNRLLWMQEVYGLGPKDRVLQKTPFGFDVSVWELFWPLLIGARLVFARPEGHKDPVYLAELIAREKITTLHFVPSMLQAFLEAPGLESLSSVRQVMASGEALPPELVRRFFARLGFARLHNLYGPTEASVDVSFWPCVPEPPRSVVPIGRPIANLRLYVVDREPRAQPIGVPGELLLGGIGLARGYLGRPELTAAAFVPDPFSAEPGERLYRTGDLTRLLPNGQVEYLGRIDHQVKIRGFRIELGEIEAVLASHPAVRECVVVAREDVSGARRLVAYVADSALEPAALRDFLSVRLPDYMVPSAFVVLEMLPLTPNGKVDRKALPTAESDRAAEDGPLAPFGPIEELLAGIWSDVLGLERFGRHESFFALGGHSLLATRVVSRLREVLGIELPLRRLFEAPTLEGLAREVEATRRGEESASAPPIVSVQHHLQDLPLSFAQQRLWFLDQLAPESPAYNIPLAVQLTGLLRQSALEAAFNEVVRRHEALRTSFLAVSGQPVQTIAEQAAVPLPLVDLEALGKPAQNGELRRLVRAEALRAFDLSVGPLIRTTLVRLEPRRHAVLVTMHHIVSDGWSLGVLLGELGALYAAFAEGRPSPLAELAIQYADYAIWQRTWLSGERLEAEIAWWKHRLTGVPATLELPVDRPRPLRQSFRGGVWPVSLAPESRNAMASLGRGVGATPFMVILALFQSLLARWSGQEDFLVGTPIAGRTRAETEPLIGFFVNTLALRSDLAGEPSLHVLLGRVRETALDAYAHQEIPFERLVEEVQPGRDLGRPALVQVLLALQNTPVTEVQVRELTFLPLEEEGETAKLDLSLHLSEQGDGIQGRFTYSTDLFEAATVARLAERFQRLLDGAVTDPDRRLSDIPLLSHSEWHQIVVEQGGATAPADERCIHDLFADQVRRSPEALAVLGEDGELTYAELGRRVRRLSLRLRAAGVRPDQPVILQSERGVGLVVGLLGILESGGAYLAVDPDLPQARLELLAADSQAVTVVTQRGLSGALPGGLRRVFLEDLEEGAPEFSELPRAAVLPGHLAYVLYTSGSTGRPKGVMVEHRQLAAYVRGVVERLALPEGASFASVSSFAADLGNTSIFVALLGGGCLHVVPRERLADAAAMADWMERHPVDGLKIVPSHLAALLTAERPERLLPRRRLVLGGEALPWNLVERVRSLAPECRLFNHYGPTETTVGVLAGEAGGAGTAPSVALGRPLGSTRAWVVDRRQRLTPLGVPGELCVGGPQVTRGYLGRPDLTAERFIPDPFGGAGERLYRTGDLVRQRPDGIEFLGRTDDQVKIRGFRIELPEIESALLALPGVREAAALVRQKGADRSLCAFVAVEPGITADALALLARLRTEVPAALVPSELAFVEALPRTSNGKIDRQALASAAAGLAMTEVLPSAVTDTDPITRIIAGIWEEVLGLPRVRPHDDFFAIGGHSLLATRVCSRIREVCAVELPLRSLFEAGTPERLASIVRDARRVMAGRPAPPIVPVPRGEDFPLSFAQQRLWLLAQIEPDSPAYNIPMAVRLHGRLDVPALLAALRSIEQRHEVLRTTFTLVEGRPVQRAGKAPRLELPTIDLQALSQEARQEELARLARAEALRPFDLSAGPVWRGGLVKLADQEHGVLITLHHIVSDGWSRGILLREIGDLYSSDGALPALPVQYADFAVWQRDWLQEDVLRDQLDYWKRQLSGAPRALELSLDRPRPAMRTFRGAMRSLTLSPELSRKITALCHGEGATPFMGLLASWAVLLGRHANQRDVLVGSPIAGRSRREVEALIGCFINTLVLRTEFSGAPDFRTLLGRVRAMALDAYSHQDLPFERLVAELVTERDLALTPLFQTLFVLQNTPVATLLSPGLSMAPVEVAGTVPKFDLSLSLTETPDAILGSLEYDTDLFDASTVHRLLARWTALLEEAVAHPSVSVADLPLLLPAERQQVLEDWNDTGEAPLAGLCLHDLFSAQATRTPEAVALVHRTGRWTYAELAARAGGMARRLLELGGGAETRVAICLERSPDLISSLLGVLAAGGAYVPIDPAYPVERRALMLEDSAAAVLVTRGRLSRDLPETGARVIDLDVEEIPVAGGLPAGVPVLPENLAYLIYTSGSTGRPKAVAIEHRSAVALAGWARETFAAEDLAGVLAATSVCFDLSVFEVFAPLAWGGRILLAENALELPSLPYASEVRLLNTVPSAAAELVRSGGLPLSVRTVNLAGEPLPAALAARLYATRTVERVLNLYGPSEDTTYSTGSLVVRSGDRMPAIGRPLPGTRAYVADPEGQLVPAGVAGELWLAGAGLARGYLGRPELTAERFAPDPFAARPGERVYRTGDLVRFRPDGELDFLGRIDHQVKVRGFRIELGEVEVALMSHPMVEDCVCIVRDATLVAYLVGETEAGELRASLGRRLPEYMVPSVFVNLEALPRTPNGKVDRKALPAPRQTRTGTAFEPPRDEVELRLARIWEDLLKVGPVGRRESFFALGGHSLLALRVVGAIESDFGRKLPLSALMQASTIERLAGLVRQEASASRSLMLPIHPGCGTPLFLVHPVGGNVFCYLPLASHLRDTPLYGIQAPDPGALPEPRTIEAMATLYIEALREVQPEGPYRLAGWSLGGVVAYEMARQLEARGSEVALLAMIDVSPPRRKLEEPDPQLELAWFVHDLRGLAGLAGSGPLDLPADTLDALLEMEEVRAMLPPEIGPSQLRELFALFRANLRALTTYRPCPYGGLLTLVRAAETAAALPADTDQAWSALAAGGAEIHLLPGDHYVLLTPAGAAAVAHLLG
jgi:amino acid adenylation domain-containing protein